MCIVGCRRQYDYLPLKLSSPWKSLSQILPFIPFGQDRFPGMCFRWKYRLTSQLVMPVTAVNVRITGTSPLYKRLPSSDFIMLKCLTINLHVSAFSQLTNVQRMIPRCIQKKIATCIFHLCNAIQIRCRSYACSGIKHATFQIIDIQKIDMNHIQTFSTLVVLK